MDSTAGERNEELVLSAGLWGRPLIYEDGRAPRAATGGLRMAEKQRAGEGADAVARAAASLFLKGFN
jgi:hypothetical protein